MKKGKVYLIGAGPGDPELLTLKGKRLLETADVIVGDYLADQRILRFAKQKPEYIYVGKKAGAHTMTQAEICQLLADKAEEGHTVVRLKGGDPFVFGRGGEEIEVLQERGIPFEEVPGVTSAIAAPAYAGIPVTHRKVAASFAVVTGHEDPTKNESSIHWDKLAGGVDTLVFLMGVGHTAMIAGKLIENGRAPNTPAAFVRWGTRPYQETYVTTLEHAADDGKRLGIKPPAVFVVGDVVALRERMRWFDSKPLFGKRVIITRSRTQSSKLTGALEECGACCTEIPSICITDPSDNFESLDQGIQNMDNYDWVVFTSQNGVDFFFKRLHKNGYDARHMGGVKLAAIGPATARQLELYGVRADCVPKEYKAEDLLEALLPHVNEASRIFIPRAKVARNVLPEGLRKRGGHVDVAEAYQTLPDEESKAQLISMLENHEADIITFTSSSTVVSLMKQLDGRLELLQGVTLASIGPITARALQTYGLTSHIISDTYTIKGLTEAIERGVINHEI